MHWRMQPMPAPADLKAERQSDDARVRQLLGTL